MSVWLWTYVVTKALPSMYTSMGYGVYIFFASALICASVYAFFFIPETKGLRIDQMDRLFGFTRPESASLAAKESEYARNKEDIAHTEGV
jgi:Sugar (and other) transporter